MGFTLLVLFAIFGAADPHATRGFTGLPTRQFTLPVRTSTLVLTPVLLGAATVAIVSFAWTRLILMGLTPAVVDIPHAFYAALFACVLAAFQTLVWSLPAFPKMRICSITALVLLLVAIVVGTSGLILTSSWNGSRPALFAGFSGTWLAFAGLAILGARLERQGHWSGWVRSSIFARALLKVQPRLLPFRTPLQAQFWIEWRRNGRIPFALWCGFVGILMFLELRRLRGGVDSTDVILLVVALFSAALTGLNLARDGSSKRLSMSALTAVRPVPVGTLLSAKLLLGAVLFFGGLAILAAAYGLIAMGFSTPDYSHLTLEKLFGRIMLTAVAFHVFVGILPLVLSGRVPGFPWSLLPLLIAYGLCINGFIWLDGHQEYVVAVLWLLCGLVIVKLAIAFWGFRRSVALGMASSGFVTAYALFWLAATGFLLVQTVRFQQHASVSPYSDLLLLPAVILIVPLARIAISPLALAMNRNR